MNQNTLYYGDNLTVLREEIQDETVDLIYLDPPFKSNASYNVLFKSPKGHGSHAQIEAFEDTWHWGEQAEHEYQELLHQDNTDVAELVQALRKFLKENDMMAYLVMMASRLLELHRVLKPTGSIYLHCDPTASHYLKLVLDGVFGPKLYKNEIIWRRTPFAGSSKARAAQFPRSHDVIFFYSKTAGFHFNHVLLEYDDSYFKRFRNPDNDPRGPYQSVLLKTYSQETFDELRDDNRLLPPKKPGANYRYKQFLDELKGRQTDDLWTDINAINPVAKERLGYPTQKPLALLERIIKASSNEGDVVLDPFCGCGTAIHAAHKLNRRWQGIDITHLAIALVEKRLRDAFLGITFDVHGTPKDLDGAQDLAARDKYQFQWWACSLVNARPYRGKKKGADSGIDGLIFFQDEANTTKKAVVSVKGGGNVSVAMVRDLAHVVQRENAQIGLFITLAPPTRPMLQEASAEGFYESPAINKSFPRIQILTIEGLLSGKEQARYPDLARGGHTFKKAQRETKKADQDDLFK